MWRLTFWLSLLPGVVLVGCGGDRATDAGPTPVASAAIGGSVRSGGSGLAGVAMSLVGVANRSATTTGAGSYSFSGLPAGAYVVTVHLPAGQQLAAEQKGTSAVTVAEGMSARVDFELAPALSRGSLAGSVRAGEAGIANASLLLEGTGERRTTTTSALGAYSFPELAAGVYTVTLTPPVGFEQAPGESIVRTAVVAGGRTVTLDFSVAPTTTGKLRIVNITGFTFAPAELVVSSGTIVRWVNGGSVIHTVTPDGHMEFGEAELGAGEIFEHTFLLPGVYPYYCDPHRDMGMAGVIRVE